MSTEPKRYDASLDIPCGVSPVTRADVYLCDDPAIVSALKLQETYAAEVAEFNAGFEAFKAGKGVDDEPETHQDQWRVGYAFAAFDTLKRESEGLRKMERFVTKYTIVDIQHNNGSEGWVIDPINRIDFEPITAPDLLTTIEAIKE